MATAAAHRVQGITELLEMILYELPPIDILVYQRVCQRWKEIITKSGKFQRALFFEPASNKLLKRHKHRYREKYPQDPTITWNVDRKSRPQRIFLNPMLASLFDAIRSGRDEKWTSQDASWRCMLLTQPPSRANIIVGLGFKCFEFVYQYPNCDDKTFSKGFLELKTHTSAFMWGYVGGYDATVEASGQRQRLQCPQNNHQLEELPCDK